jgi:hypothetical protein
MHIDRYLSLFMSFMTLGANFVSVCPARHKHAPEVHLSIEACTGHECSWAGPLHSCEPQECEHGTCDDKSLLESSLIRQQDHLHDYVSPVSVAINGIPHHVVQSFVYYSLASPLVSSPPLSIPLRI